MGKWNLALASSASEATASGGRLRLQRYRVPLSVEVALVWGVVGVLIALTLRGSLLFLATTIVIYALFALSVSVLFGWTGISSFGQAAFFGAGAYSYGLLSDALSSPLLALLASALTAGLLALLFSLATSRIIGVEFAMLTLVFGQILWLLTFQFDVFGGENGLTGVSRGTLFGVNLFSGTYFWWLVLAVVALSTYMLRRISASSLGKSMRAVRDDPVRASAHGINVKLVRVAAFTVAGVFGGVAGGLFAAQQGLVTPAVVHWSLSGEVIVMCLLGGLGAFWGPTVGALVLTAANWFLFDNVQSPLLYVGAVLLIIIVLAPGGIVGLASQARSVFTRRGKAKNGRGRAK